MISPAQRSASPCPYGPPDRLATAACLADARATAARCCALTYAWAIARRREIAIDLSLVVVIKIIAGIRGGRGQRLHALQGNVQADIVSAIALPAVQVAAWRACAALGRKCGALRPALG